jgi:putative oxidoreductase
MNQIEKLSFALLRVFGSGIFIMAGLNHMIAPERIAGRLESAPFGYLATSIASAELLVILTGIALITGGILLLIGFKTRLAALLLALILVPITLTVQIGSTQTLGPLFKNIAIMGILIFFLVNGSKAYSFDQYRSRDVQT